MDLKLIEGAVGWKRYVDAVLNSEPVTLKLQNEFHTIWTVKGHQIRLDVDDDSMLADFLWRMLPKFDGHSPSLYRGENRMRWRLGRIGFSWSTNLDTARMFARGLNAVGSGGVVLELAAKSDCIIAGPSSHSLYLNESEYTVDPRKLGHVTALEEYPVLT